MKPCLRAALPCLVILVAMPVQSEPLPLWELGAGIAVAGLPDYRGSDVRHTYVLPAPYVVYRGRFLKADREGVRAAFFESDRLEVNLSLNVGPAAGGKDNPARHDMPTLRPIFEIGPTVDVTLWRDPGGKAALDLRLPFRRAVTVEASPRQIGWLFSPNLHWSMCKPSCSHGWKFSAQAGPVFATRRHHGYFYSVGMDQAAPGRPAYAAPGGYSGTQVAAILSRRFSRYWVGTYVRYDNLNGAAFLDSPLVQRRSTLAAGIAVTWVFGTSPATVDAPE